MNIPVLRIKAKPYNIDPDYSQDSTRDGENSAMPRTSLGFPNAIGFDVNPDQPSAALCHNHNAQHRLVEPVGLREELSAVVWLEQDTLVVTPPQLDYRSNCQ